MKKIKILCIVGPTASGKSSLALELAKSLDGEIISCDSMQIYRRMDIGTAKPTHEEMACVRHHMIDIADPDSDFSCAEYVSLADAAIRDCAARGKLPIVCGGTGLYLDALLRGADFEETASDEDIRSELFAFYEREGAHALHQELCRIDPESAAAIHENNVKRVVRAIEIYRICGVTKSELDRRSRLAEDRFDATVIGLRYKDRKKLYQRIEKRVDIMMSEGLLEETRALLSAGVFKKNRTAAQAIGYKELLAYIAGEEDLDSAVDRLKTATRRYAKRQMTWFSQRPYVSWIDADEKTFEEIVNCVKKLFSKD
jgi:tRNA dimethylallyltransferase